MDLIFVEFPLHKSWNVCLICKPHRLLRPYLERRLQLNNVKSYWHWSGSLLWFMSQLCKRTQLRVVNRSLPLSKVNVWLTRLSTRFLRRCMTLRRLHLRCLTKRRMVKRVVTSIFRVMLLRRMLALCHRRRVSSAKMVIFVIKSLKAHQWCQIVNSSSWRPQLTAQL